jgi:hypothetical protein
MKYKILSLFLIVTSTILVLLSFNLLTPLKKVNQNEYINADLAYYLDTSKFNFEYDNTNSLGALKISSADKILNLDISRLDISSIDQLFESWDKITLAENISRYLPSVNCPFIVIQINTSHWINPETINKIVILEGQKDYKVLSSLSCEEELSKETVLL